MHVSKESRIHERPEGKQRAIINSTPTKIDCLDRQARVGSKNSLNIRPNSSRPLLLPPDPFNDSTTAPAHAVSSAFVLSTIHRALLVIPTTTTTTRSELFLFRGDWRVFRLEAFCRKRHFFPREKVHLCTRCERKVKAHNRTVAVIVVCATRCALESPLPRRARLRFYSYLLVSLVFFCREALLFM